MRSGMGNKWRGWMSSELAILLCMLASCHGIVGSAAPSLSSSAEIERSPSHFVPTFKVQLDPVVEYLGPRKTLTLWQLPPGPVKRVLFIAVPRRRHPNDFWDRTPGCPACTGLPEMRRIVQDALVRSYAVVSIARLNSAGRDDWVPWPQDSPDVVNIITILSIWKETHGFVNTSTVALGISSGGHMTSTLGLKGPEFFESICLMVSKGIADAWPHVRRNHYPPTFFVHCPRDSNTMEAIAAIMTQLRSLAIPTGQVFWNPHPITPNWFSELIPGLYRHTSRAIYEAFKRNGGILDDDDFLYNDVINWEDLIRAENILPANPDNSGEVLFQDAIDQELKVAYAQHTTLARRNEEIFNWFDSDHGRDKKDSSLVQEE